MSYRLPLTTEEIEKRLLKISDLAVHDSIQDGSDIKVIVDHFIEDGSEIKFKAPIDGSVASKLRVQYKDNNNESANKIFVFADANGNDVGEVNNLFAKDAIVKVILDLNADISGADGAAFVQNADTNAYLEGRIDELHQRIDNLGNFQSGITSTVDGSGNVTLESLYVPISSTYDANQGNVTIRM